MALTQCKECKKEVSDDAKSCPHCGYTGIIKDRKRAETEAVMATTGGKVTFAVIVILIFGGLYSCFNRSSKNKQESYAALSEAHKKLADDCMKWADYTDGDPLIWAQDNPETKETRIILNTDQGSFKRCDYKTKSGKRVKAEWILSGKIVRTY